MIIALITMIKFFYYNLTNSLLLFIIMFIGVLLKEIVDHMDLKRCGNMHPDTKLWMYSAHDTNVAGLLNSLNVYNLKLPPYASAVILELRKNKKTNSTYVVTVCK